MPLFHYSIDPKRVREASMCLDLDNADMAKRTAKFVLRELAAREIMGGTFSLSGSLRIEDAERKLVDLVAINSLVEVT